MKLSDIDTVSIINDAIKTIPSLGLPKLVLKSGNGKLAVETAVKMVGEAIDAPSFMSKYQALMAVGNAASMAGVRSCLRALQKTALGRTASVALFLARIDGLAGMSRSEWSEVRSKYMPFIVDTRNVFMALFALNRVASSPTADGFDQAVAEAVLKKIGIKEGNIVL